MEKLNEIKQPGTGESENNSYRKSMTVISYTNSTIPKHIT